MAISLVGREARKPTLIQFARVLGAWVAVASFVLTQFIEFSLYSIGNFEITVQRVVALFTFPLAFILMRHIRIPLPLAILVGAMILANTAAYAVEGNLSNPALLSANAGAITGLLASTILYTALTQGESSFSILGRLWVAFAAVSSILTLGQAVGLLPLWAVSSEALAVTQTTREAGVGGLMRGTGLRFDPNYQAFVLVIGVVFAQFYVNRMRNTVTLLIMLGIVATFSRMGLLIAFLIWVLVPVLKELASRKNLATALLRVLATAVILALLAVGFYAIAPQSVQFYIAQRANEIVAGYGYLASGPTTAPSSSAEQRAILLSAAPRIFAENYVVGLGAYGAETAILNSTGVKKLSHNTYLEELLTGGLLGVLVIALYVGEVARVLAQSRRADENIHNRGFILALLFAFSLMALFITLNYSTIVLFPLVVVLAHSQLATIGKQHGGRYAGLRNHS